ncbi:MAG: RraA family protein [Chloroflexota bacterium]|nr:RraA family protein [Chloroflexota bacterium]
MTATTPLTTEELDALRKMNSPTIANAIETFNYRPRNEGFMDSAVRCILPELGAMVGYAATCVIEAYAPGAGNRRIHNADYWDHVLSIPAPRMIVVQDVDQPSALGSMWGEVQANIHTALDCVGCVTNGGVRDLDEVRQVGFGFWAAAPIVSHAYIHLIDYGTPVRVGGLIVNPGDLLHADQHGVINIPHELARDIVRAADEVEAKERKIIDLCKSPGFSVDKLKALMFPGGRPSRDEGH